MKAKPTREEQETARRTEREAARRTALHLIEQERIARGLPDNREGRRAAERIVKKKIKEFTAARRDQS